MEHHKTMQSHANGTTMGRCWDSLLKFSSKRLDLGLELEVTDEEQEVGDGEEEKAEDKGHKWDVRGQCGGGRQENSLRTVRSNC